MASVSNARRLKCVRNKERTDSLSVMLQIDEKNLPARVFLGYVRYIFLAYISPPLRCYKCQMYGHVAGVCTGKQRCTRCSGDHEYRKFGQGVKLKCCNCGEERSTGCGRCKLRKKAADIQNVRIMERVLNAEALQKVKQIQNGTMRPKEMA